MEEIENIKAPMKDINTKCSFLRVEKLDREDKETGFRKVFPRHLYIYWDLTLRPIVNLKPDIKRSHLAYMIKLDKNEGKRPIFNCF